MKVVKSIAKAILITIFFFSLFCLFGEADDGASQILWTLGSLAVLFGSGWCLDRLRYFEKTH